MNGGAEICAWSRQLTRHPCSRIVCCLVAKKISHIKLCKRDQTSWNGSYKKLHMIKIALKRLEAINFPEFQESTGTAPPANALSDFPLKRQPHFISGLYSASSARLDTLRFSFMTDSKSLIQCIVALLYSNSLRGIICWQATEFLWRINTSSFRGKTLPICVPSLNLSLRKLTTHSHRL